MLSIFKPKIKVPETDFSVVNTDIHSHLIPGIDDGSKSINESIELIQSLIEVGFQKIVTTPHVMIDRYRNTPETITTGLAILKEELVRRNIIIDIEAAAEYYLDDDFENKLERHDILSINNKYLLFELSFSSCPFNLFEIIDKIITQGYIPVLAHPERYSYLHGSMSNYHRIKDTGCYFQLNTISLTGYYGRPVQKIAEELVDHKLVDFIGSDMHHLKHSEALRSALHQRYIYQLLTDYPLQNVLV